MNGFWRSGMGTNGRAALLRAGFAIFVLYVAWSVTGQSGEGLLRVTIIDKKTRNNVPAMVCVTSLADGKWRTPPDGTSAPPFSTTRDFYAPGPWKPGQIGPVRVTNGEYNNNEVRGFPFEGRSNVPYWQEPAAYFVSQPFDMKLPVGKYRLAVARGVEYLPVVEELEVRAGQTLDRQVLLERWVDMAAKGWYSGDVHVHFPRTTPEHDEFLLTWAQAEDVHVINALRMGDLTQTFFEQRGYGKDARYQRQDYALVSGQEDPRTDIGEQGHTVALNISAPVRDTRRYHLYDFMFDGVHQQGGLVGYAHKSWAGDVYKKQRPESRPTWDSSINVVRGKIDFFEIMQFRRIGLEDYYDFLSLGHKLTASAGSDVPWGNSIGEVRVYAYTGPQFSVDSWFAALKQGRTFVSNGPMLQLSVDSARPGDELKVGRNATVRVRARAWAPKVIGSPKQLEIVAQGRVIRSAESTDVSRQELKVEFTMRADVGQWIAARATAHNGALAHTSPVYVLVDGGGFRDGTVLPALVGKRLQILDYITGRLQDPKFTATYTQGEAAKLLGRVQQARELYQEMLSSSR